MAGNKKETPWHILLIVIAVYLFLNGGIGGLFGPIRTFTGNGNQADDPVTEQPNEYDYGILNRPKVFVEDDRVYFEGSQVTVDQLEARLLVMGLSLPIELVDKAAYSITFDEVENMLKRNDILYNITEDYS